MAHFHFHFNSLCGTFFGGTLTLSHSTLSFIFHFHFHFVEQHRAVVAERSEWHWFYSIIVLCWTCAIAKISSDDFVCVFAIETKKRKKQEKKYVKNVKTKVKGSDRFVLENFKLSNLALNKKLMKNIISSHPRKFSSIQTPSLSVWPKQLSIIQCILYSNRSCFISLIVSTHSMC